MVLSEAWLPPVPESALLPVPTAVPPPLVAFQQIDNHGSLMDQLSDFMVDDLSRALSAKNLGNRCFTIDWETVLQLRSERCQGYAVDQSVRDAIWFTCASNVAIPDYQLLQANCRQLDELLRSSSYSCSEGYNFVFQDYCVLDCRPCNLLCIQF